MKKTVNWEILKELSESYAVSGYEENITEILKKYIPYDCTYDRLGSNLFVKEGGGLSIMIAAHMDEVGFIVSEIEECGYLKFQPAGNMWSHVLLNQKVAVINRKGEKYYGIIGTPAVHGLSPEEREKVVSLDRLYVDMGVLSREKINEMGIKVGDMICPYNEMTTLNDEKIIAGKALDNRIGVAVGIWLMQIISEKTDMTDSKVILAATVQEEVGLRGARTVAYKMKPDLAIAVDVTLSGDTPFNKNNVKLGKGVTISPADSMTVMNRGLLVYIEQLCRKKGIPFQLSCFTDGGTDAGNIHKSGEGIPSMTLSIPMRYMHTHSGIIHKDDVEATLDLIIEILKDLTPEKYREILEKEYLYKYSENS